MTDEEVDDRLREHETGVLSLARDGDAYAIPVAYGYDGGSLRFRLGDDGDSQKIAYADATEEACFLAYDYTASDDSWSVIARGTLRRVPDGVWESTPADLDEWYAPLRVFDEAIEETELVGYELDIDAITGRRTAR